MGPSLEKAPELGFPDPIPEISVPSGFSRLLGRVQRVDLWPALTLLLMANPQREIEQRAKAVFERCLALDLAANVTDDAAKPRAQKLQFPPRAFEQGQ